MYYGECNAERISLSAWILSMLFLSMIFAFDISLIAYSLFVFLYVTFQTFLI